MFFRNVTHSRSEAGSVRDVSVSSLGLCSRFFFKMASPPIYHATSQGQVTLQKAHSCRMLHRRRLNNVKKTPSNVMLMPHPRIWKIGACIILRLGKNNMGCASVQDLCRLNGESRGALRLCETHNLVVGFLQDAHSRQCVRPDTQPNQKVCHGNAIYFGAFCILMGFLFFGRFHLNMRFPL